MEDYILTNVYLTPVWIASALKFADYANKNFEEVREKKLKLVPAILASIVSLSATGLAGLCVAESFENII